MTERELTDLEKETIEQDARNFPDDPADHYDIRETTLTVYTVNGNERFYEIYKYCGKDRMAMSYRFVKEETQ